MVTPAQFFVQRLKTVRNFIHCAGESQKHTSSLVSFCHTNSHKISLILCLKSNIQHSLARHAKITFFLQNVGYHVTVRNTNWQPV